MPPTYPDLALPRRHGLAGAGAVTWATTEALVAHHALELHAAADRHRRIHAAPRRPSPVRRLVALAVRVVRGRPVVLVEAPPPPDVLPRWAPGAARRGVSPGALTR
jgi:hypothetical protein